MRAVVRCAYVALTCFVAILIPFFGDLMGCAASLAFAELTARPQTSTHKLVDSTLVTRALADSRIGKFGSVRQ